MARSYSLLRLIRPTVIAKQLDVIIKAHLHVDHRLTVCLSSTASKALNIVAYRVTEQYHHVM